MNRKVLLVLLTSTVLAGCSSYQNPALTQLKGKHISVVQERINNFADVEMGLIWNHYYLYNGCVYAGYDMVTRNYWGVEIDRKPKYNCGEAYFETNKDGVITAYRERGYVPYTDYQSWFKDLIVIER